MRVPGRKFFVPASANSASSLLESGLPDLVIMRLAGHFDRLRTGMARFYKRGTLMDCLPEKTNPPRGGFVFLTEAQH